MPEGDENWNNLDLIIVEHGTISRRKGLSWKNSSSRGVTIRLPYDTIRITIQTLRYETYRNT